MAHPRRRSLFRPCIDLHNGEVKQIVGGTLNEDDQSQLKTNFVARHAYQPFAPLCVADGFARCSHPSTYFAELYKKHGLEGGHVIKLGPGNDRAAKDALAAWPGAGL